MLRARHLVVRSVIAWTALGPAGCQDGDRPRRSDDESTHSNKPSEEDLQAALAAKEKKEKQDLRAHPQRYLESSETMYRDDGIINSYRQLSSMRVMNKSAFAVRDVSGEVDWLTEQDQKVATMPFTLKGSLPAGDTKTFSLKDGTLSNGTVKTGATKAQVRFLSLGLVSP